MREPTRLLETATGIEREMLRAGSEDSPPSGAQSRVALALGLGVGVAVGTSGTTATAAAAQATTWLGVSLTTAKAIGVGLASVAVAAVAVHSIVPTTTRSPTVSTAPPAARTESGPRGEDDGARLERSAILPPMSAEMPTTDPGPSAEEPARVHRPVPPTPGAPSALDEQARPAHSITEEVAILERARVASASGDAAKTLRLVSEYESRFRPPMFELEAIVLRIEALDSLGRRGLALDEAQRFIAAHPNETMSQHVRSIADRIRASNANP